MVMIFGKKVKTAWVSVYTDYESSLIKQLKKNGFDLNVTDDAAKAIIELEKNKYELIVAGSHLTVGDDIDDYFKVALKSCKNEDANQCYPYDCSKISLYFIDRIKQGRKSLLNRYTPLVVMDNFSKLNYADREKYIIAGTNNIINGKMNLEEVINKLKFF